MLQQNPSIDTQQQQTQQQTHTLQQMSSPMGNTTIPQIIFSDYSSSRDIFDNLDLDLGQIDEPGLQILTDQSPIMISDPSCMEDTFRRDLNWYYEEAVAAIESGVFFDDSFDSLGPLVEITSGVSNDETVAAAKRHINNSAITTTIQQQPGNIIVLQTDKMVKMNTTNEGGDAVEAASASQNNNAQKNYNHAATTTMLTFLHEEKGYLDEEPDDDHDDDEVCNFFF